MKSVNEKATLGGEADKPRKQTESEIAVKLEPIDKLYELMATEKFDINEEDHEELFTKFTAIVVRF